MPLILTSRVPWRRRPSGLVEIDRASPLAVGIGAAYHFPQLQSLVPANAPTVLDAYGAIGADCVTSSTASVTSVTHPPPPVAGASGITCAFWVRNIGAGFSGFGNILGKWDVGDGIKQCFARENGSGGLQWFIRNAADSAEASTSTGALPSTLGVEGVHVAIVATGSVIQGYINGVASGSSSALSGPYIASSPTNWTLGAGRGTGTTAEWLEALYYARPLSDAEVRALYDPGSRWSLYQPLVRRVYFDLGGGGGTTYNESPSFAAVSSLPISAAATSAAVIGLAATAGMSPVGAATAAASMSLAATSAVGQSGAAASAASVDFTSAAAQTHAVTCLSSVSVAMSALAALTMSDGSTQNVSESLSFTATATQQMAAAAVAEAVQTYLVATGLTQVPAVTAGAALAVSASAALSHSVTGQASALVILTAATNLLMAAQANGDISYAVLHAASETLRAALATSNTITDASVASEEWHN